MPIRLDSRDSDFARRFDDFLNAKREVSEDVDAVARAIVADVVARGDAALFEATQKYDRLELTAETVRVTASEIVAAVKACDRKTLDALTLARDRIQDFHRKQLPKDERHTDALGVRAWPPLDGHRGRRPVCAGRHRRLSVVGA